MHREFQTGVCWPCAGQIFPAVAALIFAKPVKLGLLRCHELIFTAIAWARAERWSPSVRDGQDSAPRGREKRRDCSCGSSAGKWGEDLEEAAVSGDLQTIFKQRVWAFSKWCQSFYTNVPLFYYFFFFKWWIEWLRIFALSGEVYEFADQTCAEQEKMLCLGYFLCVSHETSLTSGPQAFSFISSSVTPFASILLHQAVSWIARLSAFPLLSQS